MDNREMLSNMKLSVLLLFWSPLMLLLEYAFASEIAVLRSALKFPDDGKAISGARLIDDRKNVSVDDITLCIRFNYKLLGAFEGRSTLMIIEDWRVDALDPKFSLLWFGANYPYSFIGFGFPRARGSYKSWLLMDPDSPEYEIWASNRWSHVCLSYLKSQGRVMVVKDGKVMSLQHPDPEMTRVQIPGDFLTKVYIGRCNFDFKKTCSGPEGQLSDFNIWGSALSAKEMQDWTTCRNMMKGDLVNWNSAQFDLANMTVAKQSVSAVCIPPRPGHVLFPERRNFSTHVSFCRKMRGVPSVIRDMATQDWMTDQLNSYPKACGDPKDAADGKYWAGWWDVPQEGEFSDVNTGEALNSVAFAPPWYAGEPNGGTLENCVVVWAARRAWSDTSCSNVPLCSFCELERSPDLQIRGLCVRTKFDTRYSWTREMINDRHSFRGYTDTLLFWDLTNWKLELYSNKSVFATTNVTAEYPFGTLSWTVVGDPCYEKRVNEIILNINACNSSEFNCVDGHCVDIAQKCDGKVDCPDKTDEIGCKIFTTDASYLKDVPPATVDKDKAELVTVGIDVLSILDISEVAGSIGLQLTVRLTWLETRLTLLDLKLDQDINTLTPAFRDLMWIPEVVFHNTKAKLQSLNDEKAFATIARKGKFQLNPRVELQNALIFKGRDNPITVSRIYDADFLCQFDMAMFPFDTQICSVVLVMKGNSGKFVQLAARGDLNYLGPVDLTQYFVKGTAFSDHVTSQGNVSAVKVDIMFGRRILGTMLTTFLPTVLICIVSFATNYFKAFFFEAVVTVNLTALLVMTTFFVNVANDLPKTAYIKMIDVWLLFNLFIPFAEVLLHTYMDTLREEGEHREINHHGAKRKVLQVKPSTEETIVVSNSAAAATTAVNSVYEQTEVSARKKLYASMTVYNRRRMELALRVTKRGLPLLFFLFVIAYFMVAAIYYSKN